MHSTWSRFALILSLLSIGPLACSTTRALVGGGGQTWSLAPSPRVPAADGFVRVVPGKDGNQAINIEVHHLAHPAKVFPGAMHYVVWLIPQGDAAAQNLGVLPLGEDLTARLTTKTPYRSFDIVVTAEPATNATQPSENRVLTASIRLAS